MNNIYLVGMMGSGKSVTAKELADLLQYRFVDLDTEIEAQEKISIQDIFSSKGEEAFRDVESNLLEKVSLRERQVVATGGGIVLRQGNVDLMNQTGQVIYLKAGADTLWSRVKHRTHRPLLKSDDPKKTLEYILKSRDLLYNQFNLKVDTDGKSAESVAKEICDNFNLKKESF